MKPVPVLVLVLAGLLYLSAPAIADTLYLANGGKVVGTITELRLRIGPIEKLLSRADVKSVKVVEARWSVDAADGTRYEGALDSLAIRSVAGLLNFGGKTVQSLELGSEEKPAKAAEPKPEPAPGTTTGDAANDAGADAALALPNEDQNAAETKLTPEQKAQIAALLKTAAALRDEYVKKSDDLAVAELAAVKDKYEEKWNEARQEVLDTRREASKYLVPDSKGGPPSSVQTGGLGVGLGRTSSITVPGGGPAQADAAAAEARKAQIEATIKALRTAAKSRAHVRRERVRAYYYALYRHLLTGKLVSEDAMKKIYDKAITSVK